MGKSFIRGFKKGFTEFGRTISVITNSIILLMIYFIGVGLTSIFAKLLKKNFLQLETDHEVQSYWEDIHLKDLSKESYYRQF